MKSRQGLVLIAVILGLLLVLLVLRGNDGNDSVSGQPLIAALRPVANDTTLVTIQGPDAAEAVTLQRIDDRWIVAARDGYAADVGKLRQLIIALTEARILEEKTSDPEQYAKLGVDDPERGGKGYKVTLSGPDFAYAIILGNKTQGKYRYARDAAAAASYLIDKDPELPAASDDWLMPDILDISASRIRQVRIAHDDGETIVIAKDTQEQTDFSVLDIPAGRELSYATVASGIGGALAKLALQDVRASVAAPASTTVTYDTWDGLSIVATVVKDGDIDWVSFAATQSDSADADTTAATEEIAAINARLGGWQYQLPDHKKDLLTRRWGDLLQPTD